MAKNVVREEQNMDGEQAGNLFYIWRYLSTPQNMCYRDWFLKLDKEFGAFGTYLLEGNSAPCEYGDGTCFCVVTNKNEKSAILKCGVLDKNVPTCQHKNREGYKKKIPLELVKMYKIDQGMALYDLAEKMGVIANCPQPRVGPHTFLLGFIKLSSKKTIDVYIAYSTDRKTIRKNVVEFVEDVDGKFVLLVPEQRCVSPKTIDLLKKKGYGSFVVGMDEILQMNPRGNFPYKATVLKDLEKLADIEIVDPLVDIVKVRTGMKKPTKRNVSKQDIERRENMLLIMRAANIEIKRKHAKYWSNPNKPNYSLLTRNMIEDRKLLLASSEILKATDIDIRTPDTLARILSKNYLPLCKRFRTDKNKIRFRSD